MCANLWYVLVLVVEYVVMCMYATHLCKCGILLLEDVAFVTVPEVLVEGDGVGDEDGVIVDDENGVGTI